MTGNAHVPAAGIPVAGPLAGRPFSQRVINMARIQITTVASLVLMAIVLLTWQYLPTALGVPKFIIPTLSDCLVELQRMWTNEGLLNHTISTAVYTLLGFGIGSALGAVLGYLLGMSPFWEKVTVALHPGAADRAEGRLRAAVHHVVRLQRHAQAAGDRADRVLSGAGQRAAGDADRRPRPREPGARLQPVAPGRLPEGRDAVDLPNLMAGLRIASTLAVIGVTVGELVGGNIGLGFLISYGGGQANAAMVFNAIVLLTVIGFVLYSALVRIEERGASLSAQGPSLRPDPPKTRGKGEIHDRSRQESTDRKTGERRASVASGTRWRSPSRSSPRAVRHPAARREDRPVARHPETIKCIEDFCPHRGAPLSYGEDP
jgi:NitT/TauT family transport system permease protein